MLYIKKNGNVTHGFSKNCILVTVGDEFSIPFPIPLSEANFKFSDLVCGHSFKTYFLRVAMTFSYVRLESPHIMVIPCFVQHYSH